ncbi:anti-sigma regulatory factor (Ser/Thr protein kinase) [Streptomyces sp. 846.5]|nr:sensor histidine kinase [Streptomyces sp. 846.5]TDT97928.1 anti-sigma regulatory factor (Ser/Thr protein kinase) [Streptomyces sp. 846.5]
MSTTVTSPQYDPFVHPAVFYRDEQEYLDQVGGFVRRSVAAGEPALVAVPGVRLELLREDLGDEAGRVTWVDMTRLGRNPGRILAALQSFADQHRGRTARIVGEPIWAGRSRAEILEATKHEALINTAFTGREATIVCPYDTSALDPVVVADALRTHPTLIEEGRDHVSAAYTDALLVCADCDEPLLEPEPAPDALTYESGQLAEVRAHAEQWITGTALTPDRRADLVLAISEAATNSLAHGGGIGTLRLWTASGGGVIAEVRDAGHLDNPLAGRRRPIPAAAGGGRGLWMIHQLCDLVEIRATSTGLTLRLHVAAG